MRVALRRAGVALLFGALNAVLEAGAANCTVATAGMAFGSYPAGTLTHLDAQGIVQINCSGVLGETVFYSIGLGPGAGGFFPRRMANGTRQVQYNLYSDAARATIWGNGVSGAAVVNGGFSLTAGVGVLSLPVYGRVFGGQQAHPGQYFDTVVLTVNF